MPSTSTKYALQRLPVLALCLLNLPSARAERTHVGLLQHSLNFPRPVGGGRHYNTAVHGERHAAGIYNTLTDNRRVGRETEHVESYAMVRTMLSGFQDLSQSRHILKYVTEKAYAPSLLSGGCLYLPSDRVWSSFYSYIEHPYPPLFAEMVANSFFPECGSKSLGGLTMQFCTGGQINGSEGCFEATHSGTAEIAQGLHVYATEGHVGLPGKWENYIRDAKLKPSSGNSLNRMAADFCSKSEELPEVPSDAKLLIPTQFVACTTKTGHSDLTRDMFKEQALWMSRAYAGHTPYERMPFDSSPPQQVDMQMEFDLYNDSCEPTADDDCYRIKFVVDEDCAQLAFMDMTLASKYNYDPTGLFTVVFISDDKSGILGMANFPTMVHEGSNDLIVIVSTFGLRHYTSTNTYLNLDESYDEGDTAVHEAGHSLGLFHTFEGGCSLDGDMVADTSPEAYPMYICEQESTCGSEDPVHNFMDYPPDACMDGFTELQKRRAWCVFQHYRPQLYYKSIQQP